MNIPELLTITFSNMTLSDATEFIRRMNKFVDRAERFIKIQKAIEIIEFYIKAYYSLHKNNRGTIENNIDEAIQVIQRFTKFRKRDLVIVDQLYDAGTTMDSDCDEIIYKREDFLAVYHNKSQEKLYMQTEKLNKEKHTHGKINNNAHRVIVIMIIHDGRES